MKVELTTNYAKAAQNAVNQIRTGIIKSPVDAWEKATSDIFGKGSPSQIKGCPKNAFLGLCETGRVTGIVKGNYTRSQKNKGYALEALRILQSNPGFSGSPKEFWAEVVKGKDIVHNSPNGCGLALWRNGYLN
jgi:hypothetical protein